MNAIEECHGVYAIIGGKGALEGYVRERAAKNPRIRYVGFASAGEIPAYTCASDIVYYGFDPQNPNARFSAPNKLFEALAAGRPLITGDFGEIADVVRQASCGIVLPVYSTKTVKDALIALQDAHLRNTMAQKAKRFGEAAMNWRKGEEILHREYSALLHEPLNETVAARADLLFPASMPGSTPSEVEAQ
jgi:glycosyltransferase involved in cell wall biosynthesis